MTDFERAVSMMHWLNDGVTLEDAEALLKGTGIAPLDYEEDE